MVCVRQSVDDVPRSVIHCHARKSLWNVKKKFKGDIHDVSDNENYLKAGQYDQRLS